MKPDTPTLSRIRELLDAMADMPVLVLGDVMLDVYLRGRVDRISPEGPVPVVEVSGEERRLGGAANVARNLRALGARPQLVALRGDDGDGRALARLLAEADIDTEPLVVDKERPTTCKTRIMAGAQQVCRYDREERGPATAALLAKLRDSALSCLAQARAVVLSDYGKGVLVDELVREVVAECRRRRIPVIVDPKEGHFAAYRGVDLVTPNQAEAGGSFGMPIRGAADLETVGHGLLERLEIGALMITLGEEGIALFESGGSMRRFPARAREVYDVTGAGDSVVSLLALALAAGADLAEAAVLANHAAGIVVGQLGTAAVGREALLATFMDDILGEGQERRDEGLVLDRSEAAAWAEARRAEGKSLVFTNGCFDLLHFGHLALLTEAARQGDLLVVGVNSDASVKRLKGPARPVNHLAERARLLAGLRLVDAVAPFDEDTPLELIRELRPDVLVKGDEYEEAAVVGAAEVKSWGGRVYRFPMQQGYSTTLMIEKGKGAESAESGAKPSPPAAEQQTGSGR